MFTLSVFFSFLMSIEWGLSHAFFFLFMRMIRCRPLGFARLLIAYAIRTGCVMIYLVLGFVFRRCILGRWTRDPGVPTPITPQYFCEEEELYDLFLSGMWIFGLLRLPAIISLLCIRESWSNLEVGIDCDSSSILT